MEEVVEQRELLQPLRERASRLEGDRIGMYSVSALMTTGGISSSKGT